MVKTMKIFQKYALFAFFTVFLLYFGIMTKINIAKSDIEPRKYDTVSMSVFEKDRVLKQKIKDDDYEFSSYFYKKTEFAENYGMLQRLLGKHIVDDPVSCRRVYRGENEVLYYTVPVRNVNEKAVKNVAKLKKTLDKEGIPMLFLIAPNKHTINSVNFPQGVLDYNTTNLDDLSNRLKESGVDVIDLNQEFFKDGLDENTSFYKTDTHWKNETAFWGYNKLIDYLANDYVYNFDNDKEVSSISSYNVKNYAKSYIGSMGKRVGQKYVKQKDDYSLLLPKFDTDFTYKKFNEDLDEISSKTGSFEDVFVEKPVLEDKDPYKDKYTAMMGYGQPYEVITNNNLKKNTKLLLIKDSFAMPFSAYLSNNIKNIYMIDTRNEKIRGQLTRLISNVKPDYVIFVCSSSSVFYFPEMFDF